MKTLFTSIKMPYTRVGIIAVNLNSIDICYRENHFLRLVEGGESYDGGADAKGTIVRLLKEGYDEFPVEAFRFEFELAIGYYEDHIADSAKSEIRDFLEECFKEADGEDDDWGE